MLQGIYLISRVNLEEIHVCGSVLKPLGKVIYVVLY